jgi:hypothetical protein
MPTTLPHDLIMRLKPLLIPYMRDRDEREALFIDTYFLRDPRPLDQINFEGSPEVFASRCIADLIKKIGCLAEDGEAVTPEHALAALLSTVRARCGVEKHAEIDYWLPILNDQCAAPSIAPATPTPVIAPAQTIDTPIGERAASVFISYSHANEDFAGDLIAALGEHGHRCWIDTSKIKGGADWQRAICDGINLAYAMVVVCTRKALESDYVWDEIQWARTRRKLIIPVLLEDVTDDDRFFGLHRYQGIRFDKLARPQAVAALIAALPTPPSGNTAPRVLTQREHELAYLDRLRFEDFRLERFELAEYTALPGEAHARREVRDAWQSLAMEQEFAVIRHAKRDADEIEAPPEKFTDAVSKITELRRVVVLGEPGAGKTHTLRAIAKPLYTAALYDAAAPIPLLVKLGNWDKADQPFETFLHDALGELGRHLDDLFAAKRAILLLDGLNEFPADQRKDKYPQVERFIKAHPDVMAVVTCREADYPISLHLSRVLIRPLDPLRIRDFARRALRAVESDDAFFWKLVGAHARRFEARFMTLFADQVADWESVFWVHDTLPADVEWEEEFINGWWSGWNRWRALRDDPAALLTLARNPYMLRMLLDVYIQSKGELPSNRGRLFDEFVFVLLKRERRANKEQETLTQEEQELLAGLQAVAFEMQSRRAGKSRDNESSAGTALDMPTTRSILGERLSLALSTSILTSGDEVRFSHQLLQEYFTALYLRDRIFVGANPRVRPTAGGDMSPPLPLQAADIWKPEAWWERTNWEEAAILLAGLYSDDCTPILNWLADASPEVAALCIARSGATTPDATKIRLRDRWLPRMTDLMRHPDPHARAAIGRALGLFTIDDLPADNRTGVSVIVRDGVKLPDIDWVTIPGGDFIYQDEKKPRKLPAFQISRYLVTYAQFQAFIDAPDGWSNPAWWEGLSASDEHKAQPWDQAFKFHNHPRERVSWYDAVAFTRWLSAKLGYAVRLPTEQEWEKAARGTDGRAYPYEGKYDPAKANTGDTGIGQTSAVGIFPNGASVEGVHDLSGNVWEWCLNKYRSPDDVSLGGTDPRVVRGGSWDDFADYARASYRNNFYPLNRNNLIGFRLVCGFVPSLP